MPKATRPTRNPVETRRKLIDAAVRLLLHQGFAATTVDQICAEAGLTKGSFFHYFDTKEAIAEGAVAAFSEMGMSLYAPALAAVDPLERLYRLLDIMGGLVVQSENPIACLVGMLSQEMSLTHPAMRQACVGHMNAWLAMVAELLVAAKAAHPPRVDFDPEQVAWLLYSLWQGSMLIGKAQAKPELVVSVVRQGRAYIESLFAADGPTPAPPVPRPEA
jgi:TetR/AcrR family transcriptional regulator, transcriptional repressor for nem operon